MYKKCGTLSSVPHFSVPTYLSDPPDLFFCFLCRSFFLELFCPFNDGVDEFPEIEADHPADECAEHKKGVVIAAAKLMETAVFSFLHCMLLLCRYVACEIRIIAVYKYTACAAEKQGARHAAKVNFPVRVLFP